MMTGIYVHLPFCPYICPYCDFAKWPRKRSSAQRYLDALHRDIAAFAREHAARFAPYGSVFLGGGTPNTYPAEDIVGILQALASFEGPHDRETTIELNPELVDQDALTTYRRAGVNRVSLGVQSFVHSEIATLGRRHTADDVARAVGAARAAGISSIGIDLIFGVPGQTESSWRTSLEHAVALDVDHISTYGLTVEPGTPYETWYRRDPHAFPGEALEADMYDTAMTLLPAAGYEQYEISNFARAGHASSHNAHYWENGAYVGFGVGAASYLDGIRRTNTRSLEEYVNAAFEQRPVPAEAERLAGSARAGEAVMLALRTVRGVSFTAFKDRYGFDFPEYYAPVIRRFREDGLLDVDADHARLTRRGRLLANDVCAAFVTFA